jgi:hypothetical protein
MTGNNQKYTDRFGHEWSVRVERKRGKPKCVTFTCGDFRLIAVEDDASATVNPGPAYLKDLFCDAERVLVHENQKWYVGFRSRMGRGGRPQGGMHTRFRSESGEIRYSKGMLHFRHMPESTLCEHLRAAQRATR